MDGSREFVAFLGILVEPAVPAPIPSYILFVILAVILIAAVYWGKATAGRTVKLFITGVSAVALLWWLGGQIGRLSSSAQFAGAVVSGTLVIAGAVTLACIVIMRAITRCSEGKRFKGVLGWV